MAFFKSNKVFAENQIEIFGVSLIAADVWSNSSRCRQESVYLSWTWCLYNDHCLDIVMSIWSSINFPIVFCYSIVCYFSWEKPLVKSTAPESLLIIFAFAIYFPLLLFSDLLDQKYKNTLLQFICSAIYLSYISTTFTSCFCLSWGAIPGRDWEPF